MELLAAKLPDGSIVATDNLAWIKNHPTDWCQWRGTNGGVFSDASVDDYLATGGARVVRHGKGEVVNDDE